MRGPSLRVAMCVAVFSVGAAVGSAPAHAAPIDKRELEARADFAAARYQKAIDTFAQLFADTADPLYLRSIGRCYQKMKRPQEAIDSFQGYLLKGRNLSKRERQEIEGYIKEMQALKASEAPSPVAPSPPASMAPTSAVAAASAPGSPKAPPTAPAPASSTSGAAAASSAPSVGLGVAGAPSARAADGGHCWRVAGIATAAGGVALIAVGLGFGAAARSAGESVSQQYDASTASAGQRDQTLQWVGYGVGAAALATGAFLYLHGRAPAGGPTAAAADAAPRWRGLARLDRRGGGVLLEGSF